MEIKDVIERIGYFRNKANLSARALSFAIDKNKAYITKLEAGEYEPSMRVILDIINACGIAPEEFFYHNINDYVIDKENIELMRHATPNKKQAIKELLK